MNNKKYYIFVTNNTQRNMLNNIFRKKKIDKYVEVIAIHDVRSPSLEGKTLKFIFLSTQIKDYHQDYIRRVVLPAANYRNNYGRKRSEIYFFKRTEECLQIIEKSIDKDMNI